MTLKLDNGKRFTELLDVDITTHTQGEIYYRDASGNVVELDGLGAGPGTPKHLQWDYTAQAPEWEDPSYSASWSQINCPLGANPNVIAQNNTLLLTSDGGHILITGTNGIPNDDINFDLDLTDAYTWTGDHTHNADLTVSAGNVFFSGDGMQITLPGAANNTEAFYVDVAGTHYGENFALSGIGQGTLDFFGGANAYHSFNIFGNVGDFTHTDLTNSLTYDASANILGLSSGKGGFLNTNVTDAQRDSGSAIAGQQIYNSDEGNPQTADGTDWINHSRNQYVMPIWAEENSTLGASNTYEWAYGNGANTPATGGIPLFIPSGWTATVVAVGCNLGASGNATIEVVLNGTPQGTSAEVVATGGGTHLTTLGTPLSVSSGDLLNFRTKSSSSTGTPNYAVMYIKVIEDLK